MEIFHCGETIADKYVINEQLAYSGQSIPYKAIYSMTQNEREPRPFFLKQYKHIATSPTLEKKINEYFLELRHRLYNYRQYFCLPIEIVKHGQYFFGVYPWIDGKALSDEIDDDTLDEIEIARFALSIVKAVKILHQNQIVHHDLKPANIMLERVRYDSMRYARIVDLDNVQIDEMETPFKTAITPGYTFRTEYIPRNNDASGEQNDIFSLGVLLYELFFTHFPYIDSTDKDVNDFIMSESFSIPPKDQLKYNFDRRIIKRIVDCLSADAAHRPRASWLHKIFHRSWGKCRFIATDSSRMWNDSTNSNRFYVEINKKNSKFNRIYYSTTEIGNDDFRGARVEGIPPKLFRLIIGPNKAVIKILVAGIIKFENQLVPQDLYILLDKEKNLTIGNAVFVFRRCF